jgi:hypothetical protein
MINDVESTVNERIDIADRLEEIGKLMANDKLDC